MATLEDVKSYLKITWTDEATDAETGRIMRRAAAAVNNYLGTQINFICDNADNGAAEGTEQEEQLFLDCCRYIRENAFEDFAVNFRGEITALREAHKVKAFEAERAAAEGGS